MVDQRGVQFEKSNQIRTEKSKLGTAIF
jgi:hypothetical protein